MDYSRIFQFQDFNRAKKKALSKAPEGFAEVGNAIFSWPPELHMYYLFSSLIMNLGL